jgi:hypothetical protein
MKNPVLTYLIAHGRHVFSPDLSSLGFTDEQSDCIILSEDEDERIGYAAGSDLRPGNSPIHVFNDLAFGSVCARKSAEYHGTMA